MMSGQSPKPIFSRRNGTNASIGVVTMIRMYGVMIFSANGFWVISAASTSPIVEPIASPARNSMPVTFSEWISVLVKSCANVLDDVDRLREDVRRRVRPGEDPLEHEEDRPRRARRVSRSPPPSARPGNDVSALQSIGPCSLAGGLVEARDLVAQLRGT